MSPSLLIPLLSAGNFVIGMGAFAVIGLLVPLADSFAISPAEAGFVLTIYALTYAVASPLAVAASGTWPRWIVLCLGMALFGLAALASALAPTPTTLFAARVLAAIGAGLFSPVAAAVAAAASPPEERGKALARVFLGLTLAQVLGVPAGSFLAYSVGWQATFALVAVLAALCVAGLLRIVPRALEFRPNSLASLGAALADWRTLVSVAFTASFLGAIYVLYTYLAPLMTERMGLGRDGITALLLVFGAGAVAGNMIGGALADRLGPRRTLMGLALAQIVLMPLFSLLPMPVPVVFGLVFVWSVAGWSFMAPQQSLLIDLAPERAPVILALHAAAIYVGAALGSALGGAVIAGPGVGALGLVAGICAVVALGNLWLGGRLASARTRMDKPVPSQ